MASVSKVPSQLLTKRFSFSNSEDNVRGADGRVGQGVPAQFTVNAGGAGYTAGTEALVLHTPDANGGLSAIGTITVDGGAVTGCTNPNLTGYGYRIGDRLEVAGNGVEDADATVDVAAVQYLLGTLPDNAIIDSIMLDVPTAFSEEDGVPNISLRVGTGPAGASGSNLTIKQANFNASPWTGAIAHYTTASKVSGEQDVILVVTTKNIDAGIATVWVNYYQGV